MTGKPQISPQEWAQMKRHYLAGNVTLKELSKLYGVGYSTLRRHASANDWFTHKRSQQILIEAEVRNRLSQKLLQQAGSLQETAGYCLPMSKEKHYDLMIKLLQLEMKLKLKRLEQTAPQQQKSPRQTNIIPLRKATRTRTKLTKARQEIEQSC